MLLAGQSTVSEQPVSLLLRYYVTTPVSQVVVRYDVTTLVSQVVVRYYVTTPVSQVVVRVILCDSCPLSRLSCE